MTHTPSHFRTRFTNPVQFCIPSGHYMHPFPSETVSASIMNWFCPSLNNIFTLSIHTLVIIQGACATTPCYILYCYIISDNTCSIMYSHHNPLQSCRYFSFSWWPHNILLLCILPLYSYAILMSSNQGETHWPEGSVPIYDSSPFPWCCLYTPQIHVHDFMCFMM